MTTATRATTGGDAGTSRRMIGGALGFVARCTVVMMLFGGGVGSQCSMHDADCGRIGVLLGAGVGFTISSAVAVRLGDWFANA